MEELFTQNVASLTLSIINSFALIGIMLATIAKHTKAKATEQELDAKVYKQAEAEKYVQLQEAEAIKAKGHAEAEAIEAKGCAEAKAIRLKLDAEAKGLAQKAEAMKKMHNATLPEGTQAETSVEEPTINDEPFI